jgi:hypothetical protein
LAVILMALKEHAKEAMGLSEQDMLLGGWVAAEGDAEALPMSPSPDE